VNQAAALGSESPPFTANEVVVIVDPFGYQGGELLPDFAIQRGLQPIVVLSSPDLPTYLTKNFPRARFVVVDANHEKHWKTAEAIRQIAGDRPIRAILPGTESGVLLASQLSNDLRVAGNPEAFGAAWREKASMHEFLKWGGVDHARTARVQTLTESLRFIRDEIKDFPNTEVVLKPPSSAGTDRVFFCKTEKEIEDALTKIKAMPDAFGEPNSYAVIQERLLGDEYIVDTVSTTLSVAGGSTQTFHRLVGAWRYHRRPSAVPGMADVIDHVSWVPVESLPEKMVHYARSVLDTLEVRFGPAHLEIMNTPRGPVLIELGARLPGGLPILAARATGDRVHQIDLAWESVLNPENFVRGYEQFGGTYPTGHEADIVFLSVEKTGQFLSTEGIASINKTNFPTLDDVRVLGKKDGELDLTTNVTNALLRAHFVGDPTDVARDTKKLREMHERSELYR